MFCMHTHTIQTRQTRYVHVETTHSLSDEEIPSFRSHTGVGNMVLTEWIWRTETKRKLKKKQTKNKTTRPCMYVQ